MTVDTRIIAATLTLLVIVPFAYASLHNESAYFPYEGERDTQEAERQAPSEPMGSAAGDVLFRGNGTTRDVYVELGSNRTRAYTLTGDEPTQGPVELEVPVNWTQTITVESEQNVTINLWNHEELVSGTLLSDAIDMRIVLDSEVVSEVPIFQVPAGEHELAITYTTPAVHRQVTCEENTVRDLLPEGAEIISSDLPLDTFVQKVCRIRLYHESYTPYTGVSFEVTEIAQEDVVSVYSVEQERYLYVRNNTLVVPRD